MKVAFVIVCVVAIQICSYGAVETGLTTNGVPQLRQIGNLAIKESISERLKRLNYNVSPAYKDTFHVIQFPDSKQNELVIVSANPTRDSAGHVTLSIVKLFGPYFLRQDKEFMDFMISKLGKATDNGVCAAWSLRQSDPNLQHLLAFEKKVTEDITDQDLILAITSVAATKMPLKIDSQYQLRWAMLSAVSLFIYGDEEKLPYDGIVSLAEESLKQCPHGFVTSFKNLVKVVVEGRDAKPENRAEEFGRAGMMLGSMDNENPQGSALGGLILGGLIGLAADMDATEQNVQRLRNAFDSLEIEANKVGVNLNDRSDAPYPCKQK